MLLEMLRDLNSEDPGSGIFPATVAFILKWIYVRLF